MEGRSIEEGRKAVISGSAIKKIFIFLCLAIFLVLIVYLMNIIDEENVQFECDKDSILEINSVNREESIEVCVELALTSEEQAQGLMFREELEMDSGMLFIFPEEKEMAFWMKNTLIPLDMIFISKEKKIISVEENAVPCEEDPCTIYRSEGLAMYVLEMNSGYYQKKTLSKGDGITW